MLYVPNLNIWESNVIWLGNWVILVPIDPGLSRIIAERIICILNAFCCFARSVYDIFSCGKWTDLLTSLTCSANCCARNCLTSSNTTSTHLSNWVIQCHPFIGWLIQCLLQPQKISTKCMMFMTSCNGNSNDGQWLVHTWRQLADVLALDHAATPKKRNQGALRCAK